MPSAAAELSSDLAVDDATVLAAVDGGDLERALRLLMKAHGVAIYRFCASRLGSDRADDVHQTVFIEAHRDLARFERRSSLRTWLFGIANHRCLDHIKTRGRHDRKFEATEDPGATDPSDDPSPFEAVSREQLRKLLEHCLDGLAPATKDAVLLRYRDGFQYEEIAKINREGSGTAEEKPGTLQQRVARALPVLRKCLERRLKSTEVP
ncbi:MAG TPA: RNA polymerase sigma factor [Kofleriaceae bacterium]|nr:RNA polymerase sigma factor [Kofleriaceae bacterium]